MLLLFQCLTGDGWSTLMRDTMVGPERGCDPDAIPTDCGSPSLAVPYYLSYIFIGTLVLLNIVVAVILEAFSALGDVNPDLVSAADITDFGELWAQVWTESAGAAPGGPGTAAGGSSMQPLPNSMMEMNEQQLARALFLQPPPLGLQGKVSDIDGAVSYIRQLGLEWDSDLPGDDPNKVSFHDVVNALVKASFEDHLEVPETPPPLPDGTNRASKMVYPVVKQPSSPKLEGGGSGGGNGSPGSSHNEATSTTSATLTTSPPQPLPQPVQLPPPSAAVARSQQQPPPQSFVPPPRAAEKKPPPPPPVTPPPKARVQQSVAEDETAAGSSDEDDDDDEASSSSSVAVARPQTRGAGRPGAMQSQIGRSPATSSGLPTLPE